MRTQFLYLGAEKRALGSKTDKQNWFLMIKDISKDTQKGIIHYGIRLSNLKKRQRQICIIGLILKRIMKINEIP